MQTKSFGWALLVSAALAVGTSQNSFAQEVAPSGQYREQGLPVAGWLLYPSIFVGATYDDNPNQTASGADDSKGVSLRVAPRLTGTYDGGIHRSTFYGVVDARFFNPDTVAATAGFTHLWQPMQDLIFNFYGNYTRQTDIFNSALQFNNGAIGPPCYPERQHPNHLKSVWNDTRCQSHCL